MSEQTEEQIEQERQAVASMRLAQANMKKALDRIDQLEASLKIAADRLGFVKRYVPETAYEYQSSKTLHRVIEGWEADARRAL